jgi:hypothetical protein
MQTAVPSPRLLAAILLSLAGTLFPCVRAATFTGAHQPGEGTLFQVPVPAGTANLSLRITNSTTAFSHVYLRTGATASTNDFDFVARIAPGVPSLALERPELVAGTNYALWVQTPTNSGPHGFTVTVDFNRPDARKATLPTVKPLAMDVSGVLNPGETNYFQVDVPPNVAGWRIVLSGTGSADPDIVVQRGALPGAQALKASSGRRLDTLFLPGTELPSGTYFVAVSLPSADPGNSTYSLRSEIHPLVTLDWDLGLGPEPTELYRNGSTLGGDYFFKIITTNTLAGLWRTRLEVERGDADLFLKQGALPTEAVKDHASTRAGSDGVALIQAGQFNNGQTWYVMVLGQPGAAWSLVSGNGYVPTLPPPGPDGRSGTNGVVAIEGVTFYRTTVPANALAWRVGLAGQTNVVLVNRDRAAHPLANPRPDWYLPGQLLLVPPYLRAGSDYFVSVAGVPGEEFALRTWPQPVTDVALDSTAVVRSTNEMYLTYRVPLPAEQVAWQVDLKATEGDPHLAVRDAFVGNEYVNTAYLELTNRATHLVTLVPPILHDGAYYVTVYGTPPFAATLANRRPPVSYVPYRFQATNLLPDEPGWRYYGVTNIEEQAASLGWELLLTNYPAGTELALRRNRAPGTWQYRSNLVQGTVTAPLVRTDAEIVTTNGYLQRPQHPADIWYVGVRHPLQAAGPYVLTARDIPVKPLGLGSDWRTESLQDMPPGYVQYFRVDAAAEALALEARVVDVTRGLPRLAVGRDLLPLSARSMLPGGSTWGTVNTSTNWPSGAQVHFETDWTGFNVSAQGTNESGMYFFAGRGNPLTPGTYYLGVFTGTGTGSTNRLGARVAVRGLFPGPSLPELAFAGGQATTPPLPAHDSAWYRVDVPPGQSTWKLKVQMPTNQEGMLVLRQTGVANYGAAVNPPTHLAGTRLRKANDEHYLLLPTFPATEIPAGAYHLGVVSEGRGPTAGRGGSNSCVFSVTSEGPLVFHDLATLDPLGRVPLTATAAQAGGEVRGFRFVVGEGTPALEIRLKDRVGNPRMSMRADGALPMLSDPYGYGGGGTATWSDDDFIRIPSPPPGEYRILVQAAAVGTAYPQASYVLEIAAQAARPLTFDAGVATVTNQLASGWEYFRVVVPGDTLGWDLRFTNITRGDPRLVVCRDAVPATLTTRTPGAGGWSPFVSTNWPSGWQIASEKDWTGYSQSAGGTNQAGQVFMVPMGNPLEPGEYIVGVSGGGIPRFHQCARLPADQPGHRRRLRHSRGPGGLRRRQRAGGGGAAAGGLLLPGANSGRDPELAGADGGAMGRQPDGRPAGWIAELRRQREHPGHQPGGLPPATLQSRALRPAALPARHQRSRRRLLLRARLRRTAPGCGSDRVRDGQRPSALPRAGGSRRSRSSGFPVLARDSRDPASGRRGTGRLPLRSPPRHGRRGSSFGRADRQSAHDPACRFGHPAQRRSVRAPGRLAGRLARRRLPADPGIRRRRVPAGGPGRSGGGPVRARRIHAPGLFARHGNHPPRLRRRDASGSGPHQQGVVVLLRGRTARGDGLGFAPDRSVRQRFGDGDLPRRLPADADFDLHLDVDHQLAGGRPAAAGARLDGLSKKGRRNRRGEQDLRRRHGLPAGAGPVRHRRDQRRSARGSGPVLSDHQPGHRRRFPDSRDPAGSRRDGHGPGDDECLASPRGCLLPGRRSGRDARLETGVARAAWGVPARGPQGRSAKHRGRLPAPRQRPGRRAQGPEDRRRSPAVRPDDRAGQRSGGTLFPRRGRRG